jgi:hypothetical protein
VKLSKALVLSLALGCGEHGSITTPEFAMEGSASGTTIELSGNYSGFPITETSCKYTVSGNDLHFDVTWSGPADPGCMPSVGHYNPTMLVVTCQGPRLAPGHYVVSEPGFDAGKPLEGDIDASGSGKLSRHAS